MFQHKNVSLALKYAAYAAIFLGAILEVAAMLTAYEPTAHYFKADAPLPLLALISVTLGALCGIASALFSDKQSLTGTPFHSPVAALITCVGFLLGGVLMLLIASTTLSFLTSLLFLLSALYAFLGATSLATKKPSALALLGFLTVAACAVGNVYCYFDVSLEMNAPVKLAIQMALLFSMLYFTGELRFLLGRAKIRLYLILSYCAMAACALCALAIPVSYFRGILPRYDYYALSIVALGILVSIPWKIRALSLTRAIPTDSNEPTDTDENEGDADERDVAPSEEINSTPDSPLPADAPQDHDTEEQKETDEE